MSDYQRFDFEHAEPPATWGGSAMRKPGLSGAFVFTCALLGIALGGLLAWDAPHREDYTASELVLPCPREAELMWYGGGGRDGSWRRADCYFVVDSATALDSSYIFDSAGGVAMRWWEGGDATARTMVVLDSAFVDSVDARGSKWLRLDPMPPADLFYQGPDSVVIQCFRNDSIIAVGRECAAIGSYLIPQVTWGGYAR